MNKQLTVLSGVVVIALSVGFWLMQKPSTTEFEAELLFNDLSSVANQIDSIQIENSAGSIFNAFKYEEAWVAEIANSDATYPADQMKLASLVKNVLQAKLVEAKTNNKSKHNRLGLQAISVEDSLARLVTIKVGSQSWQVLIGNKASVGEGSYVRLPKQSQSWLLDKNIDLPIASFSWLQHPILPYSTEDILSLARMDNDGWQMLKTEGSESFELLALPEGKTLEYKGILNGFVSSLIGLDYEALITAEDSFVATLEAIVELEVQTQDNNLLKVSVSQANDLYYVRVVGDDVNGYWKNWYYQVSSYSAQQLNKTIEDFLGDPSVQNESGDIQAIEEGASPN